MIDIMIDIMQHAQLFSEAAAHWQFAVLHICSTLRRVSV
jgi:hypothetical protein